MDPPRGFARRLSSAFRRLLRRSKSSLCLPGSIEPTLSVTLYHEDEKSTSRSSSPQRYTNEGEKGSSSPTPRQHLGYYDIVARHQERMGWGDRCLYAEFVREYPGKCCSSRAALISQ